MLCLVAQSCPTLCDPMDCSPLGSSVHGDSPGKNSRVACHVLHQGIFPTQGSNPGLLHCRGILYWLSHQGSPRILEWVACLSQGDLPHPGIEPWSLHCRQIVYQLSYQGNPSTSVMFTNIFLLTWVYNKHLKLSTANPWTIMGLNCTGLLICDFFSIFRSSK